MKKTFLAICLFGALSICASPASGMMLSSETTSETTEHHGRVIPYPAGMDTTSEGASSAPKEINHSASRYFVCPDFYELGSSPDRVMLSHYPTYQQTKEYTCGPAAALTVLYYYGNRDFDEMSLATEMKTKGYPIGTNPANMVKFFERLGWTVESSLTSPAFGTYEDFQKFVENRLRRGIPSWWKTWNGEAIGASLSAMIRLGRNHPSTIR